MKRFAVGVALRSKVAGSHSLPGLPNKRLQLTGRGLWRANLRAGGRLRFAPASRLRVGPPSVYGRCTAAGS
jgi:hypothetical protein